MYLAEWKNKKRDVARCMESSKALRAALLLAVSALFLSSTAALPRAASTPFLAETSRTYWIGYYDTGVLGPMLSIRGYLNGSPVPISVSLFMYTPRAIYAIGHYYGEGSVDINLTGSLVRYIAGKWRRDDGWPSLLAFVDYLSNDTVRTAILAVPYNPSWLLNGDKILIAIAVNFGNIKPLPWPKAVHRPNITSTPASSTRNASGDPYGYTYLGSCMGNTSLDVYIQGNEPDIPDQWVLESCYEFEGPLPLFYVAWGSGVWNNGVIGISINTVGANYAEMGSGFYASYAIYNSTGYYVISAASAEPTWSFTQNTNIFIYSPSCGISGVVSVVHGNSLGVSYAVGVPIYTVPGSGVLYLGPVGDIAAVTFYDCAMQAGVCTPIYIANGTMVLDVTSYSSGNLYLYPYIDVGNGTITATLSYLIGQGLAGRAFTLLDGQSFYYNPGIGYVVETSPCSNAPAPMIVTTSSVEYVLQNVINSYKAGIPGWAADVGGAIVEYLAEAVLEDPLLSHLVGFAASYLLSYLESSTALVYHTYAVRVATNSSLWGFYVTFVGTQAVETGNGASNWPMGVVINGTGYYLSYSLGEQCRT